MFSVLFAGCDVKYDGRYAFDGDQVAYDLTWFVN